MGKQKNYWVFCHKCEEMTHIDDLIEKPLNGGSINNSILHCSCGYRKFGIERNG